MSSLLLSSPESWPPITSLLGPPHRPSNVFSNPSLATMLIAHLHLLLLLLLLSPFCPSLVHFRLPFAASGLLLSLLAVLVGLDCFRRFLSTPRELFRPSFWWFSIAALTSRCSCQVPFFPVVIALALMIEWSFGFVYLVEEVIFTALHGRENLGFLSSCPACLQWLDRPFHCLLHGGNMLPGGTGMGFSDHGKKRQLPDGEASKPKRVFSRDDVTRVETDVDSSIHSEEGAINSPTAFYHAIEEPSWLKQQYSVVDPETSLTSFSSIAEGRSLDASSICASTDGIASVYSTALGLSRPKRRLSGQMQSVNFEECRSGKSDAQQSEVTISGHDSFDSSADSFMTREADFREESGISHARHTKMRGRRSAESRQLPDGRARGEECASCSGGQNSKECFLHSNEQGAIWRNLTSLLTIDETGSSLPGFLQDECIEERRLMRAAAASCRLDIEVLQAKMIRGDPAVSLDATMGGPRSSTCEGEGQMTEEKDTGVSLNCEGQASEGAATLRDGMKETSLDDELKNCTTYVHSSGRLSLEEEARLGRRASTIDLDFEEYFSELVL